MEIQRKIERVPTSYEVGSGPFCKASSSDCMPGYRFEIDKESKGCWTGSKGKCVFDNENWKKSDTYRYLTSKKGEDYAKKNMPNQLYLFGTAPMCNGTLCDVFKAGKWPIGTTTTGKGEEGCWTGSKYIGIDPVSSEQREKIEEYRKACMMSDDLATQSWIEFWKAFGKTADAVGGIMSGGVSSAVSGATRGLIEGLRSNVDDTKKPEEKKVNPSYNTPEAKAEQDSLNSKIDAITKPLKDIREYQNWFISEKQAKDNIAKARQAQREDKARSSINRINKLFNR